jgi:hypothetical protein
MAKNFHNGTNVIAKHDTIFLREEILEFFMAPTVKTHLNVLVQKIPALYPGAKGVGDRETMETYLNSASKNTSETDIFPRGTKSLLTSVIFIMSFCTPLTFYILDSRTLLRILHF